MYPPPQLKNAAFDFFDFKWCIPFKTVYVDIIQLHEWDADSLPQLSKIIEIVNPNEIYNFAALSSGEKMYQDPAAIGLINGLAVSKILSTIQELNPQIRFCQASSSEMFGKVLHAPQTETTPFNPRSPYGAAKLYGHQMIDIYRERYPSDV